MSSSVTLNDKTPRLRDLIKADAGKLALMTAFDIKTHATISMNAEKHGVMHRKHVASAPGESPAVHTGTLVNSLAAKPIGEHSAEMSVGAEYGISLELGTRRMSARPFVRPAAEAAMKMFVKRLKDMFDVNL